MGIVAADTGSSLTGIGTLFTTFTGWMGDIVSTMASNPVLMIPIGIFCVGAAIGLASRLIGR